MRGWIATDFSIWLLSIITTAAAVAWLGISVQAGILIAVAVTLGWASYLSFLYFRKTNVSSETSKTSQPDPKSYSEAQIGSLRLGFEKTAAVLKGSNLKGPEGDDSPWFLVLGPPASGKTSLMFQTGMESHDSASYEKASAIRGTINCEWWLSKEGVFLDTAGRYVSQEKDRLEWLVFIDLLRKYRKTRAINGVLLVVDTGDIILQDAEHLRVQTNNLRTRLNELIQRLGTIFPVYLIFTKCDLVHGFTEFFENLSRHDREQMWGCTFSRGTANEAPAHKRFQGEIESLVEILESRVAGRLMAAQASEQAQNIFSFPTQVRCLQDRLVRFVEQLFQSSAFHENPIFRGFYFTSSVQSGSSIDLALSEIAKSAGIELGRSSGEKALKEPRSFFIKNLFYEVIFKDGALAGPSFSTTKQRRMIGTLLFATSILLSSVSIGWFAHSFLKNKELTEQLLATGKATVLINSRGLRHFSKNVKSLEELRVRLDQLTEYSSKGVPLVMSAGLYPGNELLGPAEELYWQLFSSLYLNETQTAIESELRHFISGPPISQANDSDRFYSLLKLYLMMAVPSHFNRHYAVEHLQRLWDEFLLNQYGSEVPRDLSSEVHAQISRYVDLVNDQRVPFETIDRQLVGHTQEALRKVPLSARYFARIKRDSTIFQDNAPKTEPYTLERALAGQRQILFANKLSIPSLFTAEGWKLAFPLALEKVLNDAGSEGWVLNVEEVPHKEMRTAVEILYLDEYAQHWRQFVQQTRILPAENLPDILNRLEILSRKNSQLVVLLRDIDRNTWLSNALEDAANKLVGVISNDKIERRVNRNAVQTVFESFHEFVATSTGDAKESGLDRYMSELGKAASALTVLTAAAQDSKDTKDLRQARLNTEVLLHQLDKDIREDLRPLLIQPFLAAQATASKGEIEGLNQSVKQELAKRCVQTVASKYPFKKGVQASEDVPFSDLAAYFHPQVGSFWKFYQAKLQPAVQEENGRWVIKTSDLPIAPGFLDILHHTDLITQSLFGKGSPEPRVSFDIRPNGVPGIDEIRLKVDGRDLLYRNEKEEWYQFVWPGSSDNAGANVEVVFSGGKELLTLKFEGRWGFFKLLDAGRVIQMSPTEYIVEWTIAPVGGTPAKVKFDLRTDSAKNPFVPGLFSKFRCPTQVGL